MESLTLEQVYYFAEIIGVLTIVMSLVYVAMQIRQNTMAIRSDTAQSVHETWGGVYQLLSGDSDLTQIVLKGNHGMGGLSESGKVQYVSYWMQTILMFQNAYYQYKSGSLEDTIWNTMEKTMLNALISSPGFRDFWEARKSLFDENFRGYVDNEISTRTLTPGYKMFGTQEPIPNSTD